MWNYFSEEPSAAILEYLKQKVHIKKVGPRAQKKVIEENEGKEKGSGEEEGTREEEEEEEAEESDKEESTDGEEEVEAAESD